MNHFQSIRTSDFPRPLTALAITVGLLLVAGVGAALFFLATFTLGGGSDDAPLEPPEGARIVEGTDGWLLGVPDEATPAGEDVEIWYNGSHIERGQPVEVTLGIDGPDWQSEGNWQTSVGGPGWTFFLLQRTAEPGSYVTYIREPDTGERLAEASFTVEERD